MPVPAPKWNLSLPPNQSMLLQSHRRFYSQCSAWTGFRVHQSSLLDFHTDETNDVLIAKIRNSVRGRVRQSNPATSL